jgi:hypothetical protein
VLRAARILALTRGGRPRYDTFDFPGATLTGRYNAIIMVNWIHDIDPETLREAVALYLSSHLRPLGALILDTVQDAAYTYNHDIQRLAPPGVHITHLGRYSRHRDVWALRPDMK